MAPTTRSSVEDALPAHLRLPSHLRGYRVSGGTGYNAYWHLPFKNDHSIRLLKLLPGSFHSVIEIELMEVSLYALPDYEALSYAWDSETPDRQAICEGKELAITQNCTEALRRLRGSKPRLLWIDSICIDQSSWEERNHQVQRMGEIYSKAKSVIIWLGECSRWSDFTISLLNDYYDTMSIMDYVCGLGGSKQDDLIRKLRGILNFLNCFDYSAKTMSR
jgi:hypothetical protein